MSDDKKLVSGRIDAGIHRKFKIACAVRDITVQDAVAEMIEGWLADAETETEFWVLKEYLVSELSDRGDIVGLGVGEPYDKEDAVTEFEKALREFAGRDIHLVKVIKTDRVPF